VSVAAAYLGLAPGQPAASAAPTPSAIAPKNVELADDGTFATAVDLTAGRWAITVTAEGDEGKTTTLTREVAVAYKGIRVVIKIRDSRTWLKVWVDGVVSPQTGAGGKVYDAGKTLTVRGENTVEVRTGKMSTTYVTVNGTEYGALGTSANPGTFQLEPGKAPREVK
jgi:hypothetical protein